MFRVDDLVRQLSPEVQRKLRVKRFEFLAKFEKMNYRGIYYDKLQRVRIARHWVNVDDALGKKTVFHEFAHSLEDHFTATELRELGKLYGRATLNPELAITEYSLHGPSELWAENFGYFMIRPDAVMKKNRAMYDFIANFLARISRGM